MSLLLLAAAPAFAACQYLQAPTPDGALLTITAVAEPLSCRRITLRATGTFGDVDVRVGKKKVRRDHVVARADEVEIGLPELVPGDVATVAIQLAGDNLEVSLGEPPPRAVRAAETHTTWTVGVDPKHPGWGFADPKFATTVREVATLGPDGHSREEVAGALAQGRMTIPAGSFTLDIPGGEMSGWGGPGVRVERVRTQLRFVAPGGGEIAWRVSSVAGAPIIPDGRTYIEGLDWRFRQVSLPEPAIPVRYASVTDKEALARSLYADVQALAPGWLPTLDALHPRQLNGAWRSGWATPVEAGLILDRILKQVPLISAWVLTGVAPEKLTLTGYDRMLVAARIGDRDVLLDPACPVCAFDEVSTRLVGKPAIGATDVVPLSAGRLTRKLTLAGTEFAASVQAEGAAALWLRELAYGLGDARRAEVLAAALGLEGARISTVEGLDELGAPVHLELVSPRPPRPVFEADPPWVGGWEDL